MVAVRRAWRPAGIILIYHRVANLPRDPWRLAVSPEKFEEQLQIIKTLTTPMPLRTFRTLAAANRLPPRAMAMTFDDGYRESLHAIKPLLERYDVPATFFVTSGYLDGHAEFWWDQLEQIVSSQADPTAVLDAIGHRDTAPANASPGLDASTAVCRTLWTRIYTLSPAERTATLDKWAASVGTTLDIRDTHRCVTPEELYRLDAGGLTTIGGHTVSHPPLATLDVRRQSLEISQGKKDLEDIVDHPITSFAYPIGRASDFTEDTVQLVREHGFQLACTTSARPVTFPVDDLRLPRVALHDLEADRFEEALMWWFREGR
ncbi:MAG TPA: polysaccharide deacetylase family protein [Nitrospirales bacterium]|nr:polysaccharide deacetylase family protein [Nitrospirales bacterium]